MEVITSTDNLKSSISYQAQESHGAKILLCGNRDSNITIHNVLSEQDGHHTGCSIGMLILLSGPRLALQMAWAAQWAALTPYLQNLLPPFAVNITQFIGPVTGILVAPTVGVLSDACTSKYGRRRPFLLFGALTSSLCWMLMAFTREFGEMMGDSGTRRNWTAAFTVFFYLWMDITVNIVSTPAQLIIADFAGDRQTTGAAIGQAASTVGALLVAGYIFVFGPASKSLLAFMSFLSIIMMLTVLTVCAVAKERVRASNGDVQTVANAFKSIWIGITTLPGQLAVFAFIFFCVQFGYTSYNGSKGQFFGLEMYSGNSDLADVCGQNCTEAQQAYNNGVQLAGGVADLLYNCLGYVSSFCIPFLVQAFGVKYVLLGSMLPQMFLMYLAYCKSVAIGVVIVVMTAITQNIVFGLMVPTIVHVIGGTNSLKFGLYVGAMNSANCAGQFLNFMLASMLVTTSMRYALPILVGGCVTCVGFFAGVAFFKISIKSI